MSDDGFASLVRPKKTFKLETCDLRLFLSHQVENFFRLRFHQGYITP